MNETLLWVSLSVVAAISLAGIALVSEYQKHPTLSRLFWLRLITLTVAAPVSLFVEWPQNPKFYICMAALSALICCSDALYYSSAKKYGAGVTTRIEPLSVLMTFVAWVGMTPSLLADYMARPAISAGIVACFVGAGYFAMRLRHCEVSAHVLKRLSPVIIIIAVVSILAKMAMDSGSANPLHTVVVYLVIQCGFLVAFYGVLFAAAPKITGPITPSKALLASAATMAACSVTHIATKNIAYAHVENPAYVTLICLAAPIFIAMVYHLNKRADETDRIAGFGIVISAVFLIILTRF